MREDEQARRQIVVRVEVCSRGGVWHRVEERGFDDLHHAESFMRAVSRIPEGAREGGRGAGTGCEACDAGYPVGAGGYHAIQGNLGGLAGPTRMKCERRGAGKWQCYDCKRSVSPLFNVCGRCRDEAEAERDALRAALGRLAEDWDAFDGSITCAQAAAALRVLLRPAGGYTAGG